MASLTKAVVLPGPITLLRASLLLRSVLLPCALAFRIAFLLALPIGSCLIFGAPALLLLNRPPPFLIALRLCPAIWFDALAGLGAMAGWFGAVAALRLIPARPAQLTAGPGTAAWRMHVAAAGPMHRATPWPAWANATALVRLR